MFDTFIDENCRKCVYGFVPKNIKLLSDCSVLLLLRIDPRVETISKYHKKKFLVFSPVLAIVSVGERAPKKLYIVLGSHKVLKQWMQKLESQDKLKTKSRRKNKKK